MMATYTALWLAQSFISLGFAAVFAALSLGLAWLLVWFRLRSLGRRADAGWLAAYRFWVRIFALALVLASAGGVVVLIQLPALWPGLPQRISAVSSPLLALALASVLICKTCFLGPMLFAQRRLHPAIHTFTVLMVAVGVTLALTCLLVLGTWMQTPAGTALQDGQIVVRDWGQVLRNPAMPWYTGLYVSSSLLGAACVVLAVTARQGLTRAADSGERLAFRSALVVALVSAVTLAVLLPGSGRMTALHQPAAAAAGAAYWHSGEPADAVLFAWPDATQKRNRAALAWPDAGRYWLGVDAQGHPRGLDQFSGMHPPVAVVFLSMRGAWLVGLLTLLTLVYVGLRRWWSAPDGLSRWERTWLMVVGWSGAWLLPCGMATLLLGAYPFAVQGAITLNEIMADASPVQMIVVLACTSVVYGLLLAGFVAMIRHAARYGVIPVARHRGRA